MVVHKVINILFTSINNIGDTYFLFDIVYPIYAPFTYFFYFHRYFTIYFQYIYITCHIFTSVVNHLVHTKMQLPESLIAKQIHSLIFPLASQIISDIK